MQTPAAGPGTGSTWSWRAVPQCRRELPRTGDARAPCALRPPRVLALPGRGVGYADPVTEASPRLGPEGVGKLSAGYRTGVGERRVGRGTVLGVLQDHR